MDINKISIMCMMLISSCYSNLLSAFRIPNDISRDVRIRDCGTHERAIQVLGLDIQPSVIRIPGKVRVWPRLNITRDLPELMGAVVSLSKISEQRFDIYTNSYISNICEYMNAYYEASGCPKALRKADIPCRCPLPQGLASLDVGGVPLSFPLPEPCIEGQFRMAIEIISEVTREQLGCIDLTFFVKKSKRDLRSFRSRFFT